MLMQNFIRQQSMVVLVSKKINKCKKRNKIKIKTKQKKRRKCVALCFFSCTRVVLYIFCFWRLVVFLFLRLL